MTTEYKKIGNGQKRAEAQFCHHKQRISDKKLEKVAK